MSEILESNVYKNWHKKIWIEYRAAQNKDEN